MVNNSHFPALEGELIVRGADGEIREKQIINQNLAKGTIIAKIADKEGNVISERTYQFRSFVDNMALMMLNILEGETNNMVDTSQAIANTDSIDVQAGANVDTHGVQVGRNTAVGSYLPAMAATVNKADYALRNQCDEGTGASQFNHGATVLAYTNGDSYMTIARDFTNNSGATITVAEIAIVGDSSTNKFMVSRDVDDSVEFPFEANGSQTSISLVVAAAQVLTVTYKFEIADSDGLLNSFLGFMASILDQGAHNVNTCEVNASSSAVVSIDFHTNPTYGLWTAAAGAEDQGFLVGDNTTSTSRSNFILDDIDQDLTHAEQTAGVISYPAVAGREIVSNNTADWEVYKTRVGASRSFTNGTASAIALDEGAIALAGSASTARIPIIRFKFPAQISLNAAEVLQMTLRISMITNVTEK